MRRFRIGDKVQAFWDPNISGKIVEMFAKKTSKSLTAVGPTDFDSLFVVVELKNGKKKTVKYSEVFIVDYN